MNREIIGGETLETRVEALIGLNYKPISRHALIESLDLSKDQEPQLDQILENLSEEGSIRPHKRGYISSEPLSSIAVVRVSGIKKNGPKKYDKAELTLANDPEFPFEIKISKSNAQKNKLVNGETLLVALHRNGGDTLSARIIDRYRRSKSPVLPVKFTKEALNRGSFAEVVDGRAKGVMIPVRDLPEDPKKHSDWNAEIPRTSSIYDTTATLKDERFEQITGNRVVDILASKHGISHRVSGEVATEAKLAARRKLDLTGYRDLTHLPVQVVDPVNPFDRDDGIYVEFDPYTNGFRTLIMNADVCARVPPASMMFEAAVERGTSHFFPHDRKVFPMLHKTLVQACSLHEGGLKPVDYVETFWNDRLEVIEEHHGLGVIQNHRTLSYGQMEDRLMAGEDQYKAYRDFFERAIDQRRAQENLILFNGEQDFISPASVFLVAYLMTHANDTRAVHAIDNDLPFIFRVHGFCTNEVAFAGVYRQLQERGYDVPSSHRDLDDVALNDILMQATMRREEDDIQRIIRANLLERAKYSATAGYHHGLKREQFAHTTSPVRRLSDLYNQGARHRVLHPNGEFSPTALPDEWAMRDQEISEICNNTEIISEAVASDYKHFHDFRRLSELVGSTIRCHVSSSSDHGIEIIYPSMGIRKTVPKEELPRNFMDERGNIIPLPEGEKVYVKVENVRPEEISWDVSVVKKSDYPIKPKFEDDGAMPALIA